MQSTINSKVINRERTPEHHAVAKGLFPLSFDKWLTRYSEMDDGDGTYGRYSPVRGIWKVPLIESISDEPRRNSPRMDVQHRR